MLTLPAFLFSAIFFTQNKGGPGACFSKLPVITGPVKLFCFTFQIGVSKVLNIIQ